MKSNTMRTISVLLIGLLFAGLAALVLLAKAQPAEAASSPSVSYKTHVQTYGWQGWKKDGATSGTTGKSKRLEGIYIKLNNKPVSGSIQYRTHVQKIGWQSWKGEGKLSGTTGKSLRLEAIQIKLTGKMAEKYDVYYRVHAQSWGWLGWAKNGNMAGTSGQSKRLEGIQIKLVKKGDKAPGSITRAYIAKSKNTYTIKDGAGSSSKSNTSSSKSSSSSSSSSSQSSSSNKSSSSSSSSTKSSGSSSSSSKTKYYVCTTCGAKFSTFDACDDHIISAGHDGYYYKNW